MFHPIVSIANLSENKNMAFLEFLERMKEAYNEIYEKDRAVHVDQNGYYIGDNDAERWWLASIEAFIEEYELDIDISNIKQASDTGFSREFRDFQNMINKLAVRASSPASNVLKQIYVISNEDRAELAGLINKIRLIINEKLEASNKKENILLKLNALQAEIDTDNTRFERARKTAVDFTATVSEAFQELKPAIEILERIKRIFWNTEERKLLTAPEPKPLLEAPEKLKGLLDDEIPF